MIEKISVWLKKFIKDNWEIIIAFILFFFILTQLKPW